LEDSFGLFKNCVISVVEGESLCQILKMSVWCSRDWLFRTYNFSWCSSYGKRKSHNSDWVAIA